MGHEQRPVGALDLVLDERAGGVPLADPADPARARDFLSDTIPYLRERGV